MSIYTASAFIEKLRAVWCSFAHDDLMWPMNGRYQCRRCLQYHRVPWEEGQADAAADVHAAHFEARNATSSYAP